MTEHAAAGRKSVVAESRVVAGLVLVAFFLRIYTIGEKSVWLDEAFSIWLANQPLADLWGWLIKIDQHPPLYYTLLHLWQLLVGDWQGAVRLCSAFCSTLALPFFYGAGRRFFDRPTALIATVILATAPFHIRYAQETRMYALLTLTVAITLYLLARLLCDSTAQQPRWIWLALGTAQAAVMITHNTAAVFFPLALNLAIGGAVLWLHWRGGISALIGLNRPGFERRWLRGQGVAFLCWLPWSIPFVIQSIGVDHSFWIPFPSFSVLYETFHNFHLAHQPGTPIPWLVGDLLYWALGCVGIWTLRRRGALLSLLLALFFAPILGEWLISLRRPIFSDRTLIWTTLAYYWLIAVGIRQAGRWLSQVWKGNLEPFFSEGKGAEGEGLFTYRGSCLGVPIRMKLGTAGARAHGSQPACVAALRFSEQVPYFSQQPIQSARLWTVGLLLILVMLNGQALINYYRHFTKEGWDQAAAYVAAQAAPGDLILFNATWVQLPFDYYFRHFAAGKDARIPRHGVPVDLFDRGVLEPKMTAADQPYLQQLLTQHRRIWLIYSHDWYTDPNGLIPRTLGQQRRLVADERFPGVQVLFYRDNEP